MYYIYALIDPRNNLPFYIGKGLKNRKRHMDHFRENIHNTPNRHKFYKIEYLRNNEYEIEVKILVDGILNEEEAYEKEESFIKLYGRENIDTNGILTNVCLDKRPPSQKGKKHTEEHVINRVSSLINNKPNRPKKITSNKRRQELSETMKGEKNPFYGKTHSEETKLNQSLVKKGKNNPFFGKKHSEETILKMSRSHKRKFKTYLFVSPENIEYIVDTGFNKFCKEHKISLYQFSKEKKNKDNCWKYFIISNEELNHINKQ